MVVMKDRSGDRAPQAGAIPTFYHLHLSALVRRRNSFSTEVYIVLYTKKMNINLSDDVLHAIQDYIGVGQYR